jgi:hypothetical protein
MDEILYAIEVCLEGNPDSYGTATLWLSQAQWNILHTWYDEEARQLAAKNLSLPRLGNLRFVRPPDRYEVQIDRGRSVQQNIYSDCVLRIKLEGT